MKKGLFITLGLALGLGIGAVAGLSAKNEAKVARADFPAVWYITGNYEGGAWGTFEPFALNDETGRYEKTIKVNKGTIFKMFSEQNYSSYEIHREMDGSTLDYNKGWYDLTNADGHNFRMNYSGVYTIYYSPDITGYGNPAWAFGIEDVIQIWIDGNMHLNDYDKDGTIGSTTGDGSCTSYYSTAKNALLALGNDAVNAFSTDADSRYTTALTRYNEWARINKDSKPFEAGSAGSRAIEASTKSGNASTIIVAISASSLLALGGFLFLKKRKEA